MKYYLDFISNNPFFLAKLSNTIPAARLHHQHLEGYERLERN